MKNPLEFEIINGKVCCPECLEEAYGYIYKVSIKSNNKEIYICDECESVWTKQEDIIKGVFRDFKEFMNEINLTPFWTEFNNVEKRWYSK